jgi:transcriptional regulator with XRE-family HTH domain
MSRKEVAKLFCVAVSTVYRWECGEVPMLVQRHARLIFAEFERDVRAKMEAIDRDYEATREQREPAARLVALSHDI